MLAVLGLFTLLWGLPALATVPKIGRNTTKKQAFWILMRHLHFFVCCVLIGYLSYHHHLHPHCTSIPKPLAVLQPTYNNHR